MEDERLVKFPWHTKWQNQYLNSGRINPEPRVLTSLTVGVRGAYIISDNNGRREVNEQWENINWFNQLYGG